MTFKTTYNTGVLMIRKETHKDLLIVYSKNPTQPIFTGTLSEVKNYIRELWYENSINDREYDNIIDILENKR